MFAGYYENEKRKREYIFSLIKQNRRGIIRVVIIYSISSIATIASIIFTKKVLDVGIDQKDIFNVILYSSLFLLANVLTIFFESFGLFVSEKHAFKILDKQKESFLNLLYNNHSLIDTIKPSDFKIAMTRTLNNSKAFFADLPRIIVSLGTSILGSLITVFVLDKISVLIIIIAVISNLLIYIVFRNKIYLLSNEELKIDKSWKNIVLKVFSYSKEFLVNMGLKNTNDYLEEKLETKNKLKKKSFFYQNSSDFISNLFLFIIVFLLYALSNHYKVGVSTVIASVGFSHVIFSCSKTCLDLAHQYKSMLPSLNDSLNWQERLTKSNNKNGIKLTKKESLEYYVKSLSFAYPKKTIFNNADFSFPKTGFIIFNSENGSGKSTLIKIPLNILPVSSGETNIDYQKILYLPQNSKLFNESIKFNIILAAEFINEEEEKKFNNLLNILNMRFYIDNLPLKENTVINFHENMLSGGEIQKILVARSLFYANRKDIIIFDELFANTDIDFQERLVEVLKNIATNKLIILITHNSQYFSLGKNYKIREGQVYYE